MACCSELVLAQTSYGPYRAQWERPSFIGCPWPWASVGRDKVPIHIRVPKPSPALVLQLLDELRRDRLLLTPQRGQGPGAALPGAQTCHLASSCPSLPCPRPRRPLPPDGLAFPLVQPWSCPETVPLAGTVWQCHLQVTRAGWPQPPGLAGWGRPTHHVDQGSSRVLTCRHARAMCPWGTCQSEAART